MMVNMTEEELRAMIRDAIAADRAEKLSHPAKREKMTRFTDNEDKTWVSVTLERGEMVRKVLLIIAVIVGSTVAAVQFTNTWFLLPTIDRRAGTLIAAHEVMVREEMKSIVPKFLERSEFETFKASRDERWDNQAEFNRRVDATLTDMQSDIKEILKRLR